MRASTLRSPRLFLSLVIAALLPGLLLMPTPAAAEEQASQSGREHKDVARGLQAGIKALHRLGGQDETIRHLQELLRDLRAEERAKRRTAGQDRLRKKKGEARAERKRGSQTAKRELAEMIEVMWMAQEVLRKADRDEHADILTRSVTALKMMWADRDDDEALDALLQAPSQKEQIKALVLARRTLLRAGDKRRAAAVLALHKQLVKKSASARRARSRRPARKATKSEKPAKRAAADRLVVEPVFDGTPVNVKLWRVAPKDGVPAVQARRADDKGHAELGELKDRLRVLRMAMPALREGERRDAAQLLERAIHTAELLLEGRKDDQAQRIYRETPNLGELSEVLHLAARLWLKFEHRKEAEAVAGLSRYYRERAQLNPEERARADQEARQSDEHEPERARARSWAHRQQEEMEERRARAREVEMQAERRREHERRVRELTKRRGPQSGEHEHRDHEHEGRGSHGPKSHGEQIEELRRELKQVQRALHELMRELHEIARER